MIILKRRCYVLETYMLIKQMLAIAMMLGAFHAFGHTTRERHVAQEIRLAYGIVASQIC